MSDKMDDLNKPTTRRGVLEMVRDAAAAIGLSTPAGQAVSGLAALGGSAAADGWTNPVEARGTKAQDDIESRETKAVFQCIWKQEQEMRNPQNKLLHALRDLTSRDSVPGPVRRLDRPFTDKSLWRAFPHLSHIKQVDVTMQKKRVTRPEYNVNDEVAVEVLVKLTYDDNKTCERHIYFRSQR